jgi:hypothetical protein
MDAGLAKVLNSTVGTSTLKALDQIFFDNVKLIASDEVLYKYSGGWTNKQITTADRGNDSTENPIIFDTSGTVIFKTVVENYNGTGSTSISITVKDSAGNTKGSASGTVVMTSESSKKVEYEISCIVNVTAGETFTVHTTSSDPYAKTAPRNVYICARPVLMTGRGCSI